ncbi:hypothetical protein R1flu_014862 [Riccia fluitans]|uniref:Uncharacterized protein n=1 Tax=Riccia fluitans TaxID=41844 RepID=A0ABD1YHB2_9MARC
MASTAEYAALETAKRRGREGGDAGDGELEFVPLVLQGISSSDARHHSEVQLSSMGGGGEEKGGISPMEWDGKDRKEWKSPLCIITSVVIAVVIVIVCILIAIPRTNSQETYHLPSSLDYRTAFHFQPHKNWMNG